MAGPMNITCPGCGESFPVPVQVISVNPRTHHVLCRIDRSGLYGHLAKCAGTTDRPLDAPLDTHPAEVSKAMAVPDKLPDIELAGRINMMLNGGHFMSKGGSGACTMCGVNRDVCLSALQPGRKTPKACCGACADGNTHPAPAENRGTCAEWGAEHGAKN